MWHKRNSQDTQSGPTDEWSMRCAPVGVNCCVDEKRSQEVRVAQHHLTARLTYAFIVTQHSRKNEAQHTPSGFIHYAFSFGYTPPGCGNPMHRSRRPATSLTCPPRTPTSVRRTLYDVTTTFAHPTAASSVPASSRPTSATPEPDSGATALPGCPPLAPALVDPELVTLPVARPNCAARRRRVEAEPA